VTNHHDSGLHRHPTTARGFAETVNWDLRDPEFFNNPQRFMDAVAAILKYELHRLLVDGIKYERIDGSGSDTKWEMLLFKNEELINYLNALQVNKSIYEYVVYDSEVEREFARRLDEREDIKFFLKLPD